jgi:hypothetical protein
VAPCPKMGWPEHPIFGQGVAKPPHTGSMVVAKTTPGLWGWSGHPERPPRKKKKKRNGFELLRVARPPPRALVWLGVVRPPPTAQTHFIFFSWWPLGVVWPRTTPKGLGWLRPPPYGRYGVAEATPQFPPLFFSPNFLLLFEKKKKKKT